MDLQPGRGLEHLRQGPRRRAVWLGRLRPWLDALGAEAIEQLGEDLTEPRTPRLFAYASENESVVNDPKIAIARQTLLGQWRIAHLT